jgi:hypothetical protein
MPGLWINNIGLNLHPESMVLGTAPLNPNGNTSRFGSKEYASLANRVWTARQGTAQNKAINDLTSLMLDAAFNIPIVRSAQVAASTAKLKNLAFSRIDDLVLDNATLA